MNCPPHLFLSVFALLSACQSPHPPHQRQPPQPASEPEIAPLEVHAEAPSTAKPDDKSEIERRKAAILAEITELWPDHPWAGDYNLRSDFRTERILISPKAGCLAIRTLGSDVVQVNWGTATVEGRKLRIVFERPNEGPNAFRAEFEVTGIEADRSLWIGFEGGAWELDCPADGKREINRASSAETERALPGAIAFAKGAELRQCILQPWAEMSDARAENSQGPSIISLKPDCAMETGLQSLIPEARLAGWVLRTSRHDIQLALQLEDPRTHDVAGRVDLTVLAGVPVCIVAAVQADELGDATFRDFSLFQVNDAELVPLLRERIFVGVRGQLIEGRGWEWNLTDHCESAIASAAVGIWSWNGGDSDFAAALQLQPGCTMGLWVRTGWQRTPLTNWPRPLWVLFYLVKPK